MMLSKIFSFGNRRTGKKINDVESLGTTDDEIRATRRPFPNLEKDAVRVLVFKDCDRKGKTLLFDSKAIVNEPVNDQDGSQDKGVEIEQSSRKLCGKPRLEVKPKQQHPRPSHDAKMLGEMIFGSVAMTYKGATVKVHEIRIPHQLLLSNVFALKPRIVMPNCCDGNDYLCSSGNVDSILDESTRIDADFASLSSQNSSPKDDPVFGASSKPMAVPRSSPVIIEPDEDSGFMASIESSYLGEDPLLLCTPVSSSCGSYKRRLYRSHITSIDHSFGRKSEEPTDEISPLLRRRPKLGIGIIFHLGDSEEKSRALQGIFFAHFPLIELHMKRLGITIENACFVKTRSFSSQVIEAVDTFRSSIYDLLAAPRLKEPVWLNMMTHSSNRSQLCEKFMAQLMDCLKVGNTRSTNFFMAAVLTAVLSHHLAWVPTVMPAGASPSRAYLDKHSSKTLDLLAQSHPYNPLWAQLGDLYGAVGFPLKVARTIVVGKDSTLVEQVLNILSYFIRCSEVFEHDQKREDVALDKGNSNSHDVSGESICLHCGSSNLEEANLVTTGCTSLESRTCLKCKQNFEELLQDEMKEVVECSVDGDISKRCQLEGFCAKCDSTIHGSAMERTLCCDDLQRTCKCNHVPNGVVRMDIKHLIKNVNLVRKTTQTDTFQCYCCKDLTNVHGTLVNETTFKCYCSTDGTSHKILETDSEMMKLVTEHNCNNLTEKSQNEEKEKVDSEETVALYGRSGSADSGIHQSPSNSPVVGHSVDFLDDTMDQLEDHEQMPEELPLPRIVEVNCCPNGNSKAEEWKSYNNFGRSLFAGICDSYLPDLVLQGTEDNDFIAKLSSDLKVSLQHSVVDDPVSEAVCIIADTDRWTCELVSAKRNRKQQPQSDAVLVQPVEVSNLILSMLTSVSGLWDIKMSAEFCLMHLEDKLKEIYFKSKVFAERVRDRRKPFSRNDLAKMLSVDDNDVALLLAVASTHSLHMPFVS